MGKPRQSIEVIIANGKKNLTKAEIEKRRAEEAAVRPGDDKIECPTWLKDLLARKEYKRIVKELQKVNLISNLDTTTLAQYCIAFSHYVKVSHELDIQGSIVEGVPNPLIKTQTELSKEMLRHAQQLGLTISSRLKLIVPEPKSTKPENKYNKYVAK